MIDDFVPEPSLGIGTGLAAFFGGAHFIIRTPRLWFYALVPVGMLMLMGAILSVLFIWSGLHLSQWLLGEAQSSGGRVFHWIVTALVALSSLLAAALVALCAAQPMSGFALEAIAQAQEEALTGQMIIKPPFWTSFFSSIRVVLLTLCVGGVSFGLLFAIGLLFPPAVIVTVPLKFLVCGWLLAWDFLDYPMAMRGMGIRKRLSWVRRNIDAFSAFGLAWSMFIFIPGVALVLLPMGVAGAARLVVEDEWLQDNDVGGLDSPDVPV